MLLLYKYFSGSIFPLLLYNYFFPGMVGCVGFLKVQKIVPNPFWKKKEEGDVFRFNAGFFIIIYVFNEMAHRLH